MGAHQLREDGAQCLSGAGPFRALPVKIKSMDCMLSLLGKL